MTTVDTISANKALARHWLEMVSAHDVAGMLRLTSPDWTMEGGPPDLPTGHEGVYALFEHIGPVRQTWTVLDVIAEGDKVVVRALNHCVQESFFGIPAADVEQVFTATFIFQIVDGLVVRTWRNAADLQRLFQLGARLLPPE